MENDIRDLIKEIKEIKKGKNVVWSSKTINTETRKLKSEWTYEMSYDISQYSGIDSSIEDSLIKEIYNNLTDDDRDLLQLYGIKI
jgi:hypothetical protein